MTLGSCFILSIRDRSQNAVQVSDKTIMIAQNTLRKINWNVEEKKLSTHFSSAVALLSWKYLKPWIEVLSQWFSRKRLTAIVLFWMRNVQYFIFTLNKFSKIRKSDIFKKFIHHKSCFRDCNIVDDTTTYNTREWFHKSCFKYCKSVDGTREFCVFVAGKFTWLKSNWNCVVRFLRS